MISPLPELPPKMEEVLASLSVGQSLKSQNHAPAQEANSIGRRSEVLAAIRAAFARHALPLTDDEAEGGATAYFERRLLFVKPKLGLSTIVANAWIHRFRLALNAVLVGAVVLTLGVAVQLLVLRPSAMRREAQFREAQLAWAHASGEFDVAGGRTELMLKGVASEFTQAERAPGHASTLATEMALAELEHLAHEVQVTTESAKAARYALEPTEASAPVSSKEQAALRTQHLLRAEGQLDLVSRKIDALAVRHRELQLQNKALETAWGAFVAGHPPASLLSKVSVDHDLAERAIRNLEAPGQVVRLRARIEQASQQLKALTELPEQIHAAVRRARSKSVHTELPPPLAEEETKALAAVAAGDVAAARRGLTLLEEAGAKLEQVFTLKIVNQPNEYTRIWTYKNNNHALKSYYVIVEALGPDGRALPMQIRSEEDGSVATVTRWAERVDESTYEAVGRDKKDDGIVQQDTFAEKRVGYLEADYRMGPKVQGADKNAGRIYRWPRKNS